MSTKKIRMIIADDDSLMTYITERELKKLNVSIVGCATDGKKAVELVKELKPDVALLDMAMPELTGVQAARIIMAECPTPLIALTGYSEREIAREAAASGIGAFLVKPPRAEEIDRAIIIACARFADLMELKRLNDKLNDASKNIKELTELLLICPRCNKIHDTDGNWHEMHHFIRKYNIAEFSDTICPSCNNDFYSCDANQTNQM